MRNLLTRYLVLCGLCANLLAGAGLLVLAHYGPRASVEKVTVTARRFYDAGKSLEATLAAATAVDTVQLEPNYDAFDFAEDDPLQALQPGHGRRLFVGPGAEFRMPSQAAKAARDGDTIEIAAGEYAGDSAVWRASNLLIRGRGGVVRLDASGHRLVQDKAIWIIQGDNVRIENIEFSGAKSRDKNGAGIRAEGQGLHLRRCFFHDNESGILAGDIAGATYRIESSEFARNGHESGQSHQIYVGRIALLEMRYNYVHDTLVGSAVKSRARTSVIAFNRIVAGRDGRGNYSIDLSSGGQAIIVGNVVQQNQKTGNYTLISYAPEDQSWSPAGSLIAHNTIVNDRNGGRFIKNHDDFPINVYNNLFIGTGLPFEGHGHLAGNVLMGGDVSARRAWGDADASSGGNTVVEQVGIVSRERLDYQLVAGSGALDAGVVIPDTALFPGVRMDTQYQHPLAATLRLIVGVAADAGAFEFDPATVNGRRR